MIPSQLLADKSNVDNLLQYLTYELQRAHSERQPLEERWIRNARAYEAEPESEERSFPWKGAANIVLPVIGTDVDTTVAGLIGSIYAAPNIWTTEALRPDMIDFAARLQEFLQWAQDSELKMYDCIVEWVTELVLQGTGILKQRYMREQKLMYEWREQPGGVLEQMVRRFATNRPDVRRVALADFFVPASAGNIQEAPWCAERLQLTWSQLESRVRAGIYAPELMDRIGYNWRQNTARSQFATYEEATQQLDRFVPGLGDRFELFEFWTQYDIARQGEPVSVLCTVHIPSNTYARIDFNPFFSQEKPYSQARFIRKPGRFYGMGLGDILWMVQEEASALHCQRLDNGTIRNTAIFKGRRGSGVKADEPIWPGRTILMDDPEKDLIAMNMGFAADSTLNEEQFLLEYGSRRSGISDYQRGGAGSPNISYSSATTTVEMLRQGRLRLDQVMREIEFSLTETGQRVVELYQQFDQKGKPFMVMGPTEGSMVQQVLNFPLDIIRASVAIKTTATNAALNKETQIRTNQIIVGMTTQFYQQALQAFQVVMNPMIPLPLRQVAFQMVSGSLVLIRRNLDAYDIQDLDRILPSVETLNAIVAQFGIQPLTGAGGAPMGQGFGPPPGMAPPNGMPPGPNGAVPPNFSLVGQQYGGPPQGPGLLLGAGGGAGYPSQAFAGNP